MLLTNIEKSISQYLCEQKLSRSILLRIERKKEKISYSIKDVKDSAIEMHSSLEVAIDT